MRILVLIVAWTTALTSAATLRENCAKTPRPSFYLPSMARCYVLVVDHLRPLPAAHVCAIGFDGMTKGRVAVLGTPRMTRMLNLTSVVTSVWQTSFAHVALFGDNSVAPVVWTWQDTRNGDSWPARNADFDTSAGEPVGDGLNTNMYLKNGNRLHDSNALAVPVLCEFLVADTLDAEHVAVAFARLAAKDDTKSSAMAVRVTSVTIEQCADLSASDETSVFFAYKPATSVCKLMVEGDDVSTVHSIGWRWFEKIYGDDVVASIR